MAMKCVAQMPEPVASAGGDEPDDAGLTLRSRARAERA